MQHDLKKYTLELHLGHVPGVAKRKRHVLILLKNTAGNFILGAKNHYPPNIYRMVGGGVEGGEENFVAAAARELQEEVGVIPETTQLVPLAEVTAHITQSSSKERITFTTAIFFYQLKEENITPSDDLDGLVELTHEKLELLIRTYHDLPQDLHPKLKFSWHDYGQIYGRIHQIALDRVNELHL